MRDENTPGIDTKAFVSKGERAAQLQRLSVAIDEVNRRVMDYRQNGWKIDLSIRKQEQIVDAIITPPEGHF